LKHRLAQARLALGPRRAEGDRWQVDVTVGVRGRWVLRPVVAFVLALAGGPMRRSFRSAVERAADGWNQAVGTLPAREPDRLRATLTRMATERPPEEPAGTPPESP
jgi:hypothetical protein